MCWEYLFLHGWMECIVHDSTSMHIRDQEHGGLGAACSTGTYFFHLKLYTYMQKYIAPSSLVLLTADVTHFGMRRKESAHRVGKYKKSALYCFWVIANTKISNFPHCASHTNMKVGCIVIDSETVQLSLEIARYNFLFLGKRAFLILKSIILVWHQ